MNATVHRGATFAAVTRVLLVVAALWTCGCGGSNGVETVVGEAGEDGSSDAPQTGDGTTDGTADSGSDRGMPQDGAADAPADRTMVDAPEDRSTLDAPQDQSPAESSTTDAPAEVGTTCTAANCPTGCCVGTTCTTPSATACGTAGATCVDCGASADGCSATGTCTCGGGAVCGAGQVCSSGICACTAASCPTGCCSGPTCTTPSVTACGTSGAACMACGATADGCSASGACTCGGGTACGTGQVCSGGSCKCDAASCPTGCCQGNTCQPGSSTNACGAGGGTCAMCPTGETCTAGACSGCNATSCASGCCSGTTCETPSATACGTAGVACVNCGNAADGCSATGTCTCGGSTACGSGQICSGGKCVCDATSCAGGCCSGTTCETPSATTCGTGGAACTSCGTSGDGCSAAGTCTCGGGNPCGTGQVCSGGKCVCDAASCASGCCSGAICETPSATTCGTGGGACVNCGTTADGCSAAGACTCGGGAACGSGLTCSGGKCTSLCGNGTRDPGEQCDDGNVVDLDGCDSTCKFEQITRATQLVLQWAHDTYCTADVLFEAVKDPPFANVHSTLQGDLNTDVTNGTDNVVFKYFAITDLTGQSGTASVGSYNAALTDAYTGAFTGNADLDWWYTLDTTTAGGSPLYTPSSKQSAGTFTTGVLNASGGHVLVSAFGTSLLDLANVNLQLPIASPASKPTIATGNPAVPPGQLVAENLDPTLTSFAKAGGTNAAPTGRLCGDTTAASLAATAVPPQLQSNCTQNFTATNNMLDVFVDGCTANFVGTIIAVTQPDQVNPDAPPAGAGGLYKFQLAGNHVTGCTDKSGTTVSLSACEAAAAYSTYLKLAADRVILKHP